jgi:alanine dehydrogenase
LKGLTIHGTALARHENIHRTGGEISMHANPPVHSHRTKGLGAHGRTLILPRVDLERLLTMQECIEVVEAYFGQYELGKVSHCTKYIYEIPELGDIRFMSAMDDKYISSKVIAAIDRDPEEGTALGGTCMLFRRSDLQLLCLSDTTHLTSMRTGAAGAVAAKYLAPANVRIVGMLGAGLQAIYQLMGLHALYGASIAMVKIYDPNDKKATVFKKTAEASTSYPIELVTSARSAVADADILVTTTPSRQPVVKGEWIRSGIHINAIGADTKGKEELDPDVLLSARIIVDDIQQAMSLGEINVPIREGVLSAEHIHATLGEIVLARKDGRTHEDEITVFDSTGIAAQDLAVHRLAYEKALESQDVPGELIGILLALN